MLIEVMRRDERGQGIWRAVGGGRRRRLASEERLQVGHYSCSAGGVDIATGLCVERMKKSAMRLPAGVSIVLERQRSIDGLMSAQHHSFQFRKSPQLR